MKRLAFIMMALLLALMPAAAQNYRDSRYYNSRTDRLDYRYNHNYGSPYYGFRIGPAFTFVNSDDSRLDGSAALMVVSASAAASATTCSMPISPTTSVLPTSATTVSTNRAMEPSSSISELTSRNF